MITIKYVCHSPHWFWDTYKDGVKIGEYAGYWEDFEEDCKNYPEAKVTRLN